MNDFNFNEVKNKLEELVNRSNTIKRELENQDTSIEIKNNLVNELEELKTNFKGTKEGTLKNIKNMIEEDKENEFNHIAMYEEWLEQIDKYELADISFNIKLPLKEVRREELGLWYDWCKKNNPQFIYDSEFVEQMSDLEVLEQYEIVMKTDISFKKNIEKMKSMRTTDNNIDGSIKKIDNEEKKTIDKKICEFKSNAVTLINSINKTLNTLTLDINLNEKITDDINEIQSSFEELQNEGNKIISEIHKFNDEYKDINSIDETEISNIKNTLKEFRRQIKELKILHIQKYNDQVQKLNNKINELKSNNSLSDELKLRISSLNEMSLVSTKGIKYNSKFYYEQIKLNDLSNLNHEIEEIYSNLGMKAEEKEKTTVEKIEDAIDKIEESEELKNKTDSNNYINIVSEIDKLKDEINRVFNMTFILPGQNEEDINKFFKDSINKFKTKINNISSVIDSLHEHNDIDENQFNNLNEKLNEVKRSIDDKEEYINQVEIIDNLYKSLNGRIDGVEENLKILEKLVDSKDRFKSKADKKKIDDLIDRIHEEISKINYELESHLNTEEDKKDEDKAIKEKLENANNKLKEIEKKYKHKKAFKVVDKISANKVYKKIPKAVIWSAGLALLGLSAYAIFPAIMQGNIMIMASHPSLRGSLAGINKILGKLINAKIVQVNGVSLWQLANGNILTTHCMEPVTALLRGLAQTSIGSAPYLIGTVGLIKKCNELIKKRRLESKNKTLDETQKLSDTSEESHELGGTRRGR